jgi:thiosulfate/3-mercaptopyruvate sulfurtransferase
MNRFRFACVLLVLATCAISVIAQEKAPTVRSSMVVSTEWVAQHGNDPDVIILHVGRYRGDYDRGHIPKARFVPSYEMSSDRQEVSFELPSVADLKRTLEAAGVGDKGRIVVYAIGYPPLTTRIYFTLDYLGLGDRAAIIDGGIEKWKSERRELSTTSPKIVPAKLTVHPRPEIVAHYSDVRRVSDSNDPKTMIVDARPPNRYKDGHIPGAVDAYWLDILVSRELPALKSPEDIRKFYENAGVKPGMKLITYCEVGQQATHDYFTSKYLGYDVAMYDGSWDEWTSAKDGPVVKGDARR